MWRLLLACAFLSAAIHGASSDAGTSSSIDRNKATAAAAAAMGEFTFAKSVVAARALFSGRSDNPYFEPLAELFAGKERMDAAWEYNVNRFPDRPIRRNEVGTRVSRHMLIDKFLRDAVLSSSTAPHGPRQVVILGAGFESRANRFHREIPVNKWFEVDLPATQSHKEEILRRNGIVDPENLTRIACDVTQDDWLAALEDAGWDPEAPTIYILEGLVYYLTVEEAHKLLHSIPSVPSSRIMCTVVDYTLFKMFGGYMQWKSNLRDLKKAGALKLKNYKLTRDASVDTPQRYGLKVIPRPINNFSPSERIKNWVTRPGERILEFKTS